MQETLAPISIQVASKFCLLKTEVVNFRAKLNNYSFIAVAGQEGLEPPTLGFGDRCSTN